VFTKPLPSNGYGAGHMENTSCNTFSIVACSYFGNCLEIIIIIIIIIKIIKIILRFSSLECLYVLHFSQVDSLEL
jgi:hypothetical protein